ncbi:MAG: TIGR02147 family protein [Fibrobacteraceae bacterium]|nr:TIGR02147 family protein [Fibrobacteraceae bacterium]
MGGVSKISVYSYFDYREYLRDMLNFLMNQSKGSSLRAIQAELGVKGSAFFTRILDGSRPLSLENAKVLVSSLQMEEAEREYFLTLVKFGNEKNVDKREIYLKKLIGARSQNDSYALQDSTLDFFSKWYIPVIRDLLPLLPAGVSSTKIGRMLTPPLKSVQVENAIEYLTQNKFVALKEDGTYDIVDPIISTPPRVKSTLLRKYHKKNLEINSEVYDELTSANRSISSVTCSMSKEAFEKIRVEIAQFRDKVLAIAREDSNPDRVCHLGIQFLTRAVAKGENNEK